MDFDSDPCLAVDMLDTNKRLLIRKFHYLMYRDVILVIKYEYEITFVCN